MCNQHRYVRTPSGVRNPRFRAGKLPSLRTAGRPLARLRLALGERPNLPILLETQGARSHIEW